jgi:hypothetical protein
MRFGRLLRVILNNGERIGIRGNRLTRGLAGGNVASVIRNDGWYLQ